MKINFEEKWFLSLPSLKSQHLDLKFDKALFKPMLEEIMFLLSRKIRISFQILIESQKKLHLDIINQPYGAQTQCSKPKKFNKQLCADIFDLRWRRCSDS
jgi:hypothetical protein